MIVIALGANQPSPAGPPEQTLRAALASLAGQGIGVLAVSRFYRAPAWPNRADPPFVNAVAAVETELGPAALLARLHAVEDQFGRVRAPEMRPGRWTSTSSTMRGGSNRLRKGPSSPIPGCGSGPFVLAPLRDIAPNWRHPATGEPVLALLKAAETAENRAIAIA